MNPSSTHRFACHFHVLALVWTLVGFSVIRTRADGVVIPPIAVPTHVSMPDQRALLSWSNGVETLVIETRFVGAGTNFAWVVPLPAVPRIAAATTGLFPTLLHLLRPEVVHSPPRYWAAACVIAGLVWLSFTMRFRGKLRPSTWIAVAAISVGVGSQGFGVGIGNEGIGLGLVAFITVGSVAFAIESRGARPLLVLFLAVLGVLFAGMFVPALGGSSARAPSMGIETVEVLDRKLAGVFETTTLSAKDPAALQGWLQTNGYALPAGADPVIADYLARGWVFVASRVRRDAPVGVPGGIHPLSFVFPSKEPVYPLALTALAKGNLELDLFVFGPRRASVAGLVATDCHAVRYTRDTHRIHGDSFPGDRPVSIVHEGLLAAVPRADVVTRLRGTLTTQQMKRDALVEWEPFAERHQVFYSAHGALFASLNWTSNALCALVVSIAIASRWRRVEPSAHARKFAVALVTATVATAILWLGFPVVPVRLERWSVRQHEILNNRMLALDAIDSLGTNHPVSIGAVRAAINRAIKEGTRDKWVRPGTGFREEDSPGNYTLRDTPDFIELRFYDANGRPVEGAFEE